MSNNSELNENIFECKMYVTDLETNKNSKEINILDLIFKDWVEFEFGNYIDEDYSTLPYKDFKFFINDYSVTIYSPQYEKSLKEINGLNNIITELEKDLNNEMMMTRKFDNYNEGYFNATLHFYNKLKELKESSK